MVHVDHKARITKKNLAPATLQLIRVYYPAFLRDVILACCERQLAGDYRRTCRKALCPACCPRECYKLFKAQYARFEACTPPHRKGPRLAHEVYTLPPYLRERIRTPEGFRAWAQATRATIREIHGADVAGVMNFHPIGEENISTFHPHWDVVINGYLLTDTGRVKEHRPAYIHFDDARRVYARRLAEAFGLITEPRVVDIYLDRRGGRTFHTDPRKTKHMVRYSARHIYQPQWAWLNDKGSAGDWWYRPEKRKNSVRAYEGREVMDNLLFVQTFLRTRKGRIWFGYMQNRVFAKSVAHFQAFRIGGDAA